MLASDFPLPVGPVYLELATDNWVQEPARFLIARHGMVIFWGP